MVGAAFADEATFVSRPDADPAASAGASPAPNATPASGAPVVAKLCKTAGPANDILVHGAKPLFFLDYIAMGAVSPERVELLVRGLARGCREVGCALIGGEQHDARRRFRPGSIPYRVEPLDYLLNQRPANVDRLFRLYHEVLIPLPSFDADLDRPTRGIDDHVELLEKNLLGVR